MARERSVEGNIVFHFVFIVFFSHIKLSVGGCGLESVTTALLETRKKTKDETGKQMTGGQVEVGNKGGEERGATQTTRKLFFRLFFFSGGSS